MQRESEQKGMESGGEHYITATEAREDFSDFINRVAYGKERLIVKRREKKLAAVIPMEEYRLLEQAIEAKLDRIDAEEADKVMAAIKRGEEEVIPFDQAMREIEEGKLPEG